MKRTKRTLLLSMLVVGVVSCRIPVRDAQGASREAFHEPCCRNEERHRSEPTGEALETVAAAESAAADPAETPPHVARLYRQVLDERDALLVEVAALGTALDDAQESLHRTKTHATELELRIHALSADQRSLLAENAELAARLTTAQIRRLEAEKILLETRIAWHQDRL